MSATDRAEYRSALGKATTAEVLTELALRMEQTQNSNKGRELGRLCREALENLDGGVQSIRRTAPWGPLSFAPDAASPTPPASVPGSPVEGEQP